MTFAEHCREIFAELKRKHGSGDYSWAEGMNRKIARKIARDVARKERKKSDR